MGDRRRSDDPFPSGKVQKGKQHERVPSITFTDLSDSDLAAGGISQLQAGVTSRRHSGSPSEVESCSSSQLQSGSAPGRSLSTLPGWTPHSPRGQIRHRQSDSDRQREISYEQRPIRSIPNPDVSPQKYERSELHPRPYSGEHGTQMHTLSRGGYSPSDSEGLGPARNPFLMHPPAAAATTSTSCAAAASATTATNQDALDPVKGRMAKELTVPFRKLTLGPEAPVSLLSAGIATAEAARERERRVSAVEQPRRAEPSFHRMISPQPGPRENRFYRQDMPGIEIEEREVSPSPKPRKGLRDRLGMKKK